MTGFAHVADAYRTEEPNPNVLELSLQLSTVPCGPSTHATSAPTEKSPRCFRTGRARPLADAGGRRRS